MADELERAAHYEQNKGGASEWEETEQPDQSGRRLGAMFSVRLQPDELDSIRALAARRGMSVSALLRDAALKAVAAEAPLNRCEKCGRSWRASSYVHCCFVPVNKSGSTPLQVV